MTEKEAIEKLDAIEGIDRHNAHVEADGVLLDFLRANGYEAIADAWKRADGRSDFWYS